MTIHVVKEGETLASIAGQHGISEALLSRENQVPPSGALAVGQTLVVVQPTQLHTVQRGESVYSIAKQYGISVNTLYQNNYFLHGQPAIMPGETLVIFQEGEKLGTAGINGYAYPFVDEALLNSVLPYMTYLTPFTYGISPEGDLLPLNDAPLLSAAGRYGTKAFMHLSTLTEEGGFDSERAVTVLTDEAVQQKLIRQVEATLRAKRYYGLDVDFEFVPGEQRQAYADFITALRQELNPLGYPVVVALAPKSSADQKGLLYEAHDYALLGAAANAVLLMTYEWGFTYGPPMAVAPLPEVQKVLAYALTVIPPEKIFLGMPNYGYDWPLPFEKGVTRAQSISQEQAFALAVQYGVEIQYDETAQAPFFHYTDAAGKMHEVWFEDARSADVKLRLIAQNSLQGAGFWNLMRPAPQTCLVLSGLYDIERLP